MLDEYEREQRVASEEVQRANAAIFRNIGLSNPVAAAARSVALRSLSRIGPVVRRMTEKEALVTQKLRSPRSDASAQGTQSPEAEFYPL